MANNFDDIYAIRKRFLERWNANSSPIVFDNEPPVDQARDTIWARFTVSPQTERRRSIAARTYEVLGRIYIQIFIPEGRSDQEGWLLAENAALTFRDWRSVDYRIRCDVPEFLQVSDDDDSMMISVSIPYTAQH